MDSTSHGLLDKFPRGNLPPGVEKEVLHPGKKNETVLPPYPDGTRLKFHFQTMQTGDGTMLDDSDDYRKLMEIVVGTKFRLEIWELALNTMKLNEASRFIVPKSMCGLYPVVAAFLRDEYMIMIGDVPRLNSCCILDDLGYQDLDELWKMPQDLTFTFELIEVNLKGEFEIDFLYMTTDEKMASIASLQESGNKLFEQKMFKGASDKYFEGITRIGQLLSTSSFSLLIGGFPSSQEIKDFQKKEIPLLLNYAFCKQKEQKYKESIFHLNCVLELDPENVKGLFRRGQCLKSTGSYNLAREDFARVLQLNTSLQNAVKAEQEEMLVLEKNSQKAEKQIYQRMFTA